MSYSLDSESICNRPKPPYVTIKIYAVSSEEARPFGILLVLPYLGLAIIRRGVGESFDGDY